MARPVPPGGRRTIQILVRVNEAEAARIDQLRGAKSRPAYLLWKALRHL